MINGKNLRAARKRKNLTTDALARAVGLSRTQIVRYEAEQTDTTGKTLKELAIFLDVSTDYLLGLTNDPGTSPNKRMQWNIDTTHLLSVFAPEKVAQVVKAFDLDIQPNPLVIDKDALFEMMDRYPPGVIARFFNELGLSVELAESDDSRTDTE